MKRKIPRSKVAEVDKLIGLAIHSAKEELERSEHAFEEGWRWEDLIHVSFDSGKRAYDQSISYGGEWRIGSDFEDGLSTLVYKVKGKQWCLREPREGYDTNISYEKAEDRARSFFSGYFG